MVPGQHVPEPKAAVLCYSDSGFSGPNAAYYCHETTNEPIRIRYKIILKTEIFSGDHKWNSLVIPYLSFLALSGSQNPNYAKAAKQGKGEFMKAFSATGAACKSCHDDYRQKQ